MDIQSGITDYDFRYADRQGNLIRSRTALSIARLLEFMGTRYEYDVTVPGDPPLSVDFKTADRYIMVVDDETSMTQYKAIRERVGADHIMALGHPTTASRLRELDDMVVYDDTSEAGSIFLEDPSFSFDYAHILPLVEKCSILHGHTSSVMVEMVGSMRDGLLVDFSEAKKIVRESVAIFDHKFFINRRYLVHEDDTHYRISFDGPKGKFDLQVPIHTTYLLDGEATVENLSTEIIRHLIPRLPNNVEGVGVYIYEGYNKGSHTVSRIPAR